MNTVVTEAVETSKLVSIKDAEFFSLDEEQLYIVTSDVTSTDGTILVHSPTLISKARMGQLRHLPLKTPLLQNIAQPVALTNTQLKSQLLAYLESHGELNSINQSYNHTKQLDQIFKYLRLSERAMTYLAAIEILLPSHFDEALFSAWLNSLIANQMELSPNKIFNAFTAGLLNDVGMLGIPLSIANKQKDFSPEEWAFMCEHPRISTQLLNQSDQLDKLALEAILNHHEKVCGSGYPNGVLLSKYDPVVQTNSFTAQIFSIWQKQLVPNGGNFFKLETLLQVHASHSVNQTRDAERIFIKILQKSHEQLTEENQVLSDAHLQKTIDSLHLRIKSLSELIRLITLFKNAKIIKSMGNRSAALVTLLQDVDNTIAAIGLDPQHLEQWIKEDVPSDPTAHAEEIFQISTAIDETLWKFRRLYRGLNEMFSATQDVKINFLLAEMYDSFQLYLDSSDS